MSQFTSISINNDDNNFLEEKSSIQRQSSFIVSPEINHIATKSFCNGKEALQQSAVWEILRKRLAEIG